MIRWIMNVELTFDVDPEDIRYRYDGDAEVDYSDRALERVRPALKGILKNNPFAHYHILSLPRRVEDG